MKITATHLLIVFLMGVFFTYVGFRSGIWMGSAWYEKKATQQWYMSSYYWLDAKDAFVFYGIVPMWLGGLAAGIAINLIFAKRPKLSMVPFFLAIIFTGLGFNTLDWMLSGIYGSGPGWEAWTMNLGIFLDTWDFYILLTITPLFLGGLFIGLPLAYFAIYGNIER